MLSKGMDGRITFQILEQIFKLGTHGEALKSAAEAGAIRRRHPSLLSSSSRCLQALGHPSTIRLNIAYIPIRCVCTSGREHGKSRSMADLNWKPSSLSAVAFFMPTWTTAFSGIPSACSRPSRHSCPSVQSLSPRTEQNMQQLTALQVQGAALAPASVSQHTSAPENMPAAPGTSVPAGSSVQGPPSHLPTPILLGLSGSCRLAYPAACG